MKKVFEEPIVEIVVFEVADIITESGDPTPGDNDGPIL